MTVRRICHRCGKSSCPTVDTSIQHPHPFCPREELDELTAEWLALLTGPDGALRFAAALAELSFNVKALRKGSR